MQMWSLPSSMALFWQVHQDHYQESRCLPLWTHSHVLIQSIICYGIRKKSCIELTEKLWIYLYTSKIIKCCCNTDGPRDLNIKWNKSGTERQVPYNLTHLWNSKKAGLIGLESTIVVIRDQGGERWFNRHNVTVRRNKFWCSIYIEFS